MGFDRSEREPDGEREESDSDGPEIPQVEVPEVDVPEVETPEVEAPEVEVPEVDVPEVETSPSDVPSEFRREFWALVLVLNAAILAVSLAAMILFFWRSIRQGGLLLLGGIVLFAFAYRRYRTLWEMAGEVSVEGDEAAPGTDAEN